MHHLAWTALALGAYGLLMLLVVRMCQSVAAMDRAAHEARRRWMLDPLDEPGTGAGRRRGHPAVSRDGGVRTE